MIDVLFLIPRAGHFVFFTDEASFHLNGYICSQKSRIWSAANPLALHENPLHLSKIGVWRAVSRKQTMGHSFLKRVGHFHYLVQLPIVYENELRKNKNKINVLQYLVAFYVGHTVVPSLLLTFILPFYL
jgi:hypothetical protein